MIETEISPLIHESDGPCMPIYNNQGNKVGCQCVDINPNNKCYWISLSTYPRNDFESNVVQVYQECWDEKNDTCTYGDPSCWKVPADPGPYTIGK